MAVYKFACAGYIRTESLSDLQYHPYGESILLEQYEQPKFLQINDRQFLALNGRWETVVCACNWPLDVSLISYLFENRDQT